MPSRVEVPPMRSKNPARPGKIVHALFTFDHVHYLANNKQTRQHLHSSTICFHVSTTVAELKNMISRT